MAYKLSNWMLPLISLPVLSMGTLAVLESDISLGLATVLFGSAGAGMISYARSKARLEAELMSLRSEKDHLSQRLAQAEDANDAKNVLLANVSHEIRTPLSAILGFVELMDDSSLPVNERLAFSKIIRNNSEYLIKVVNDILDLSKIESGKLEIASLPTDLTKVVSSVVDMLKIKADEKDLALTVEFRSDFPKHVYVDEGRVRQILVNLIGNAIKFTDEGAVTIYAACTPSRMSECVDFELIVRDTGEGIDPAMQDQLFTMFTQCSNSNTDRLVGSGIGLALSRRLARLMGGEVDLLRSVPGQGSSFVFRLPARVAEANRSRADSVAITL